jgi:hypothetical protein
MEEAKIVVDSASSTVTLTMSTDDGLWLLNAAEVAASTHSATVGKKMQVRRIRMLKALRASVMEQC